MNIVPEFRTSIEWKKFKNALKHPAAMELYVALGCELEGITRKNKKDTGHLGTSDPEDLILMSGADSYKDIEALHLEDALLSSGIMTKEDDGYRIITWEEQNANLISNRKNGRKGGRKKTLTEDKETESNLSEWERNLIEGNHNKNIIENNVMEPNQREHNKHNLTELNITDGITHGKPTGNGPYSCEDPF